jgi:hypothetical protein
MVQSSAPGGNFESDKSDGLHARHHARFHRVENLSGILHDKTPIKLRVTLMFLGVADGAQLGG